MSYHSKDAYEVPGKLEIPYRYMAGKTGSRFLTTLRDEKKILATYCPSCDTVFVPARSVCNGCYKRIDDFREVGPAGMVISFTVIRYSEPHLKFPKPTVLALIKLDGADTALAHVLGEVAPEDVKIGMRVEPVFAKERHARITDIAYFAPVESSRGKSAPKPAEKAVASPVKKAVKKVSKKKPKKAAKKTAVKKAAKKAVKKGAKKTAKKAGPKRAKKVVKKTVKIAKPAGKVVKKTTKKAPKTSKKRGRR